MRTGHLSSAVFGVGLALTTFTALRLDPWAAGPGEIIMGAWIAYRLREAWTRHGLSVRTPAIVVMGFWALAFLLLGIGWAQGLLSGTWDRSGLRTLLGLVVAAGATSLFMTQPDLRDRSRIAAQAFLIATVVPLAILFALQRSQGLVGFGPGTGVRFMGLSQNPNQVALALLPIPYLALLLFREGGWRQLGWSVAGAAAVVVGIGVASEALLVSWSLSAAVGGIVLVLRLGRKAPARSLPRRAANAIAGVAIVAGIVAALLLAPRVLADLNAVDRQVSIRLELWHNGADAVLSSYLVGHGPGAYSGLNGPLQGYEAHNAVIDWATNAGLVGGLLLVAFFIWAAREAWRGGSLAMGLMALALVAFAQFHFILRHPAFWTMLLLPLAIQGPRALPSPVRAASDSAPLPERPLVSVICTTRNARRTLSSVIRSIQQQTHTRWEMVIVDDGSIDGTPDFVASLAKDDDRVVLVRSGPIGRGAALNLALSRARGPLVANIDADDPAHPRRLEVLSRLMAERPDFSVIGTDAIIVRGDEEPRWEEVKGVVRVEDATDALANYNPVCHSAVLMRREDVLSVGGYSVKRRSQFDYDLWVRLAAARYRIGIANVPLQAKRIHEGQSFEAKRRLRYLWGSAQVQARAIQELGGGARSWAVLLARLAWGLLPSRVRTSQRETLERQLRQSPIGGAR
ncbi:MAG TPA: glycosyltransferase [Candidatus Thermoplasmatota archaeon]|nr:glycosyltransferase [Candidatus Thermoplasmatota archaeon]